MNHSSITPAAHFLNIYTYWSPFSIINFSTKFEVPPSSLNMSSPVPPPAYAGETQCFRQQTLSLTPQTPVFST